MSQVFFTHFGPPSTLTHFSICFPLSIVSRGSLWRRDVGGCVCVCAHRACVVSQRFWNPPQCWGGLENMEREREREVGRETCWQPLHRQLQT